MIKGCLAVDSNSTRNVETRVERVFFVPVSLAKATLICMV